MHHTRTCDVVVPELKSFKAEFQLPNVNVFVGSFCLKTGIQTIHEIQQICEIYLPKYRNPVQVAYAKSTAVEIRTHIPALLLVTL